MNASDRDAILEGLSRLDAGGAKAETLSSEQLLDGTLLIPAHLNAMEPDILLVVGGRGTGKSHLFRLMNLTSGTRTFDLARYRSNLAGAIWLRAFSTQPMSSGAPSSLHLPGELVVQQFATGKSRTELMTFWWGLLAGAVLSLPDATFHAHFRDRLSARLVEALSTTLPQISTWHEQLMQQIEPLEAAFHSLDDALALAQRYLFATYDDLDVMAVEWAEKRALIQALLQLWLGQWRRLRRIRPKVFLRRDLFAPEFLQFPDASKLEGNKLELRWTPNQLYQLVFKGWANQNAAALHFLEEHGQIVFRNDPELGHVYDSPPSESALKKVVNAMLGEFMGGGTSKGRSFEWIPNHLQDANGEMSPRPMLNLFALTAKDEIEEKRAPAGLLLSPQSVRLAIETVSNRRIAELEEEYPWLAAVRPHLADQHAPMTRDMMIGLLDKIKWAEVSTRHAHPTPELMVADMLQVGILRLTADHRIHVPDIYLYGLKMKRRGGIRRPKQ